MSIARSNGTVIEPIFSLLLTKYPFLFHFPVPDAKAISLTVDQSVRLNFFFAESEVNVPYT